MKFNFFLFLVLFHSGKSASLDDVASIDWIPTLNMGHPIEEADKRTEDVDGSRGDSFQLEMLEDFENNEDTEVLESSNAYLNSGDIETQTSSVSKDCGIETFGTFSVTNTFGVNCSTQTKWKKNLLQLKRNRNSSNQLAHKLTSILPKCQQK